MTPSDFVLWRLNGVNSLSQSLVPRRFTKVQCAAMIQIGDSEEIMMNKIQSALRAALLVAFILAFTSLAQAQASRTWVSGVGDDANPCSRTAPCKTFAGAISKTATGGEISTLDPGGFGPLTITKSITVDGSGTLAGVLAAGTTGILINITDAADAAKAVRLRGLSINGVGTGTQGIKVIAASKVSIESTVIDGFTGSGVSLETKSAAQVFVRNTTIRNNGGAGINVVPGGGQVAISDTTVIYNGTGLAGPAGTIVSFNNNVIYGNKTGDPAPQKRN